MNHDEKTTEIEIPGYTPKNNIVRVDFASRGGHGNAVPASATAPVKNTGNGSGAPVVPMPPPPAMQAPAQTWAVDLDLRSPWVLRMIAVMFVLLLSMLVL